MVLGIHWGSICMTPQWRCHGIWCVSMNTVLGERGRVWHMGRHQTAMCRLKLVRASSPLSGSRRPAPSFVRAPPITLVPALWAVPSLAAFLVQWSLESSPRWLSLRSMASSSSAAVPDAVDEVKAEDAGDEAQSRVASPTDAAIAEGSPSLADIESQSQSQPDPAVFACSARSSDKIREDLLQRGVLSSLGGAGAAVLRDILRRD